MVQFKPLLRTSIERKIEETDDCRLRKELEGQWVRLGTDIDGEAACDRSGYSVDISGDGTRMIIGAIYNDENGSGSGQARVYQAINGDWVQVGSSIDGEAIDDISGQSVAMSDDGTRVIIGAPYNDGNGNVSGHARVYQEINDDWVQVGADIDGEAVNDQSGYSVDMSDDGRRVIIGAIFNDGKNGSGSGSGQARVYQEINGDWVQMGANIDGEASGDLSGYSVAISDDGRRVIIGAMFNDGNGSDSGHARVYQEINGDWVQVGADIDGEASGDRSGQSVAMSYDGTRVIIAARYNDGKNGGSRSGHARVYQQLEGDWVQMGADIDGEVAYDYSGYSVAMSDDGRRVIIGAPWNDGNGSDSGHARVYQEINGDWVQMGADIDGEVAGDKSGWSVAMSNDGRRVIIGAPNNDENGSISGHARVYDLVPNVECSIPQPSVMPSYTPSVMPSYTPSVMPSYTPSIVLSYNPSVSTAPSYVPSIMPSNKPSVSTAPSNMRTSVMPSFAPTSVMPPNVASVQDTAFYTADMITLISGGGVLVLVFVGWTFYIYTKRKKRRMPSFLD